LAAFNAPVHDGAVLKSLLANYEPMISLALLARVGLPWIPSV